MKFNKTIVALLAIFIVVIGAAAVSADETTHLSDDGDVTPTTDIGGNSGDDQGDDQGDDAENGDASSEDETAEDSPEVTTAADDATANSTATDAAENTTAPGNNTTANSTSGNDAQRTVSTPATGNPIIVLLIVLAVLGIYPLRK